jgi:hypothetical protein
VVTSLAFAWVVGWLALGALLAAAGRARRAAALAAGSLALAGPFAVPADLFAARAFMGLAAVWGLARVLELVLQGGGLSPARRVLHAFSVVDPRSVTRAPRALEVPLLLRAVLAAAAAAAALWCAVEVAPGMEGAARLWTRWGAGLVFVVAVADAADAGVRVALGLAGLAHPPIQRAPLASLGLREFWARRWNGVVQAWLSRNAYAPAARRHGPAAGVLAAFGASALLHGYIVLAPVGLGWAAVGALYFVVQGVLVLVESRLGLRRWPVAARRVWALGVLVATSPLFVEPALRCLRI